MITFIDRRRVKPTLRRGVETWGFCYKKAGFIEVGQTKSGLLALQLSPEAINDIYDKADEIPTQGFLIDRRDTL
jgi:hypothetical protein